jgi:hypothetical protein
LPRVRPKPQANPQPTGVGNGGSRGAKPPWRGAWGVSPHKTKEGGELPPPATPPRVGPKPQANPQPTGVGKGGGGGAAPPRGFGGCPPQNQRRGRAATPATPPRVGPKPQANPQPTGVGKREVQGGECSPPRNDMKKAPCLRFRTDGRGLTSYCFSPQRSRSFSHSWSTLA